MGWRLRNPFKKAQVAPSGDDLAGQYGFGAPLQILYKRRPVPPVDNAGNAAFQTYLSPRYTAIGGGIPNKRDFVDASKPMIAQGVLVAQVGAPGILAGQFVSGPLTNVSSDVSTQPIPSSGPSYNIPAA
jgi:hypothetical protein